MLLTNMELSAKLEQAEGPEGRPGLRSGVLTFRMDFAVTSEAEIPAMMREFNDGRPTLAFWEGIEYGYVRTDAPGSATAEPIAVSLMQHGSSGPKSTLAVIPGDRSLVQLPITVVGPFGEAQSGLVTFEVEARRC